MANLYYIDQSTQSFDMTKVDTSPWAIVFRQKTDNPSLGGGDTLLVDWRYIDSKTGAYLENQQQIIGDFTFSGETISSGTVFAIMFNENQNLVNLSNNYNNYYNNFISIIGVNIPYSSAMQNINNLPAIYELVLTGDDLITNPSYSKSSNYKYNDVINAFAGNDKVQAGFGDDQINGGPGIDTSIYFGKSTDYTINIYPTHITVSDSVADRDGNDILFYVEKALFSDYTIDFTKTAPVDKTVYLMYKAALGRMPDQSGFDYWTSQAETKNYSSLDLANIFSKTDEFTDRFGTNPTNTAYVLKLYDNVLGRAPEPAGLNYWVGRLDAGTSKEQVLSSFALGDENLNITAPHVDNGFWLQFG